MKNLIPKSLLKQKGIFYRNISWYDVLVAFIEIIISCGIFFGFTFISWWIRVVLAFSLFLIIALCTLVYSKNNDCRMYKLIWYKIKYSVSTKNYYNTKDLNPYKEIKNGFILTKKPKDGPNHYVGAIKIKGLDLSNLDLTEAKIKLDAFHSFLINQKKHFSIAKISHRYSLSKQAENIKEQLRINKERYDDAFISEQTFKMINEQLSNQLNLIQNIDEELNVNNLQPIFYLFFYDNNDLELKQTVNSSIRSLESIGLFVDEINAHETINVIKSIFNPVENDISDETIDANKLDLDEIFNFKSVKFKKDHLRINDQIYLSLMSISDYPTEVDYYWLSYIFLSTNVNGILNAKQIPQPIALNLINKAIVNSSSNQYNEKNQVRKMEFEAINDGFKEMTQNIIKQNLVVFETNILLINYDVDYHSLIKSNKEIIKIFNSRSFKVNKLKYRQFEALNSFLPKINDSLIKSIGREIPSSTLANGYCFIDNILDDRNGLLLGTNWLRSPIFFDQFKLDEKRKNHNMMILGSSGSGKSYFSKKLLNWHVANNNKVFIIDVEREYKNLTKNYDGNWLDIGGGSTGTINPLQIMRLDKETSNIESILNHLLNLESFLKILFNELTNQQLRYLVNIIKEYYLINGFEKKNLDVLDNEQWPIFNDIYLYAISDENNLTNSYNEADITIVHELLRSELSNEGKLAFLYNKHTSISVNKQIACFDLHHLFEKNNQRIIQAQLFLSLNYIQDLVKNNDYENESIIIFIDEAHLLIDENNPIALDFVYQMVKRIRKRNGGIILVTQNPDDFMSNENIAKKTKAIVNNTQYSFFFNLSSNNIDEVNKMYKSYGNGLSEEEKMYIAKANRGQALFFVSGFDRHKISIFVSKQESDIF